MDDKTVIRFPNDNTVIRPRPGGKRQSNSRKNHNSSAIASDRTLVNFKNNPLVSNQSKIQRTNYSQSSRNIMAGYRSMPNSTSYEYKYGETSGQFLSVNGLNELIHFASILLSLMIKLSNSVMHNDVPKLKYKLQDEIKQFEINAGRAGISNDKILQARYVLCTSLDEIVVSTPWGQESNWSQQSLLSLFHGETWGGEKFYLLLERLLKEPGKNLDILELIYICISLGFQGKYRVIDNGQGEVEHLRDTLYRQLRSLKNDFNKELSNHWRGVSDRRGALIRYVPLWVVGALSGVILLAMFSSFTYMLDQSSTPVINEIIKLGPSDFLKVEGSKSSMQDEDSYPNKKNSSVLKQQQIRKSTGSERLVKPPQRKQQSIETSLLINKNKHVRHSLSHQQRTLWRSV